MAITRSYAVAACPVLAYPNITRSHVMKGELAIDADPIGSTAKNIVNVDVVSTQSHTSGYARGLYVSFTQQTNAITSTGEVNGIGVDVAISQNVPYTYCISLYTSQSGNPTSYVAAMSVYMDNMGTGVTGVMCLDLGMAQSSTPADTTRFVYIRCRAHVSNAPTAVMRFEGAPCATYLFSTDAIDGASMISTSSGATTVTHKVAVNLNGTVRYIKLYSDA